VEAIKANVPKLAKLRRQVQLAADQAWPWLTPVVSSIRKACVSLQPVESKLKSSGPCEAQSNTSHSGVASTGLFA